MTATIGLTGRYWLPVAAYAGLIYWASDQVRLPGPSLWLITLLGDKVVHAIAYSILGVLCYRAFRHAAGARAARAAFVLAMLAAAVYGATDEAHQVFVPYRDASGWDLLADTVGAALGVYGVSRATRRRPPARAHPARGRSGPDRPGCPSTA